jgi:tetratricopeptide (TPR) repeat protein
MEAYKPLMQNMAAQPLYQQIETAPLGALSTAAGMSPEMLTRPAVSPLFGVLGRQDQQRLLQELAQRQPALAQAQAQEAVAGQVKPLYEAIQPGPLQPEQAQPSEAQQAALAAGKVTPPALENATNQMTPTGQDVFMDMLIRQNEVRRQLTGESPTSRPGVESPAVERRDNELVVHHLAGVSADQLNQRMRVAEKLLSQGRYYEAAGEYRAAIALNRTNPLPWVGAGIALFGADDMLSAAAGVYEGLRRFPPAMETRFDIEGLLGQPMAQKRIGQLEERIERAGNQADPSLVFLAAFVRQCMGRNDLAVAHVRKLLAYDSQDPLYQAYAHYLLAGHSPTPATAPAER